MRTIGITGGIGTGKTAVLTWLKENCECEIVKADWVAHEVKERGNICYDAIVRLLGTEILDENLEIHKGKMAERIYAEETLLQEVNSIIHPAVKKIILEKLEAAKQNNAIKFFFLEAALLFEEHYDEYLEEIWYIDTEEAIRRKRLKESRGYSDAKIDAIMSKQLSREEFRKRCKTVIENSGSMESLGEQMQKKLEEYP